MKVDFPSTQEGGPSVSVLVMNWFRQILLS